MTESPALSRIQHLKLNNTQHSVVKYGLLCQRRAVEHAEIATKNELKRKQTALNLHTFNYRPAALLSGTKPSHGGSFCLLNCSSLHGPLLYYPVSH